MSRDAWREWRHHFVGLGEVDDSPPQWVVPGLLPPGMTLLAGDPKTFKSTLAMCIAAALAHAVPLHGVVGVKTTIPEKRGNVVVFPYEQSPGRLKYMYERRILRGRVKKSDLSVVVVKDAWEWRVDEPEGDKSIVDLMEDVNPALTVIDPWAMAHAQDENDPRSVLPLVPLRAHCLKRGTSLLVVHHSNKRRENNGQQSTGDFGRVRGTTALWGMADAGHLVTKAPNGGLMVSSEFKDFPGRNWTWRPPTTVTGQSLFGGSHEAPVHPKRAGPQAVR